MNKHSAAFKGFTMIGEPDMKTIKLLYSVVRLQGVLVTDRRRKKTFHMAF